MHAYLYIHLTSCIIPLHYVSIHWFKEYYLKFEFSVKKMYLLVEYLRFVFPLFPNIADIKDITINN